MGAEAFADRARREALATGETVARIEETPDQLIAQGRRSPSLRATASRTPRSPPVGIGQDWPVGLGTWQTRARSRWLTLVP